MLRFVFAMLLVLSCWTTCVAEFTPQPGEQIAVAVDVQPDADGPTTKVPLLLYTPAEYKPDGQPWPLVLFLHGAGERGDGSSEDIQRVAIHGPAQQAAAGRAHPFVLVSPQCPKPEEGAGYRGAWQADTLLALLDHLEAEMNIDKSRIYVTGLSMGGYGTWRLAAAAPKRFAAVAPICGGGNVSSISPEIASLPIWAFHGDKDRAVPVGNSIEMVEAVHSAGGHARLTIYPGVGHNSWAQTYDNPLFYDWLLGERRPQAKP